MKGLTWLIAGAGLGIAAYILFSQNEPRYSTGYDDIDDAADAAGRWGTRQRVTGTGGNIVGRVKEGLGRITGDDSLAGEGVADQAVGAVKDTAGKVAHAVEGTIHDLNQ